MSSSSDTKGRNTPAAGECAVDAPRQPHCFRRIAAAGITFQGGSAAVDSSTIMAALVHQLTGNAVAVGAVTAILRIGWVLPPLLVGYLAARRGRSMPFFAAGAFGRAFCIVALAYAFASGIVAVPYNDIVARSVASDRRSRLLAVRFFGGGVLALAVAAVADRLVASLAFPASYAAIVALAGVLMLISAGLFASVGEPAEPSVRRVPASFLAYLREGGAVFRGDRRFRRFVYAQWWGGGVTMAMPFFVIQAFGLGVGVESVALLLGAQTAGAIASNALWGWWGDRHGKESLLRGVVALRAVPPIAMLALTLLSPENDHLRLATFALSFFVLGALTNGLTIAVVGYLMELSPDDRRPAYSGYFNAMTAPAYLLPLLGGILVQLAGTSLVFTLAAVAAFAQYIALKRTENAE
jgi:MFS family permease